MKVVILAGGLGTRLSEETEIKPKPMVEIGAYPILWHIMKHYACFGMKEFYIALGYRGDVVKRFFLDYYTLNGNLTIDLVRGEMQTREREHEDWIVHLCDTGLDTQTGGRIRRLRRNLDDQTFMVTYGDGVSNVDLSALLAFHKSHGRIATVTAVRPPARFGDLEFDGDRISAFTEKAQAGAGWINGGYLVFEPAMFDYLKDDSTSLEADCLERLAADRQLYAFRHPNFWQCMDTLRDKRMLESLWQQGRAPWKVWNGR